MIRALEIISISNKKVSDFSRYGHTDNNNEYNFRCFFVYYPREILYQRIEMRCDEMLACGLIEEVKRLKQNGLLNNLSASQAIGYRQCLHYLETPQSPSDWEELVWQFKKCSRRYAKRQFTWFKKDPLFRWLDIDIHGPSSIIDLIVRDYESIY